MDLANSSKTSAASSQNHIHPPKSYRPYGWNQHFLFQRFLRFTKSQIGIVFKYKTPGADLLKLLLTNAQ